LSDDSKPLPKPKPRRDTTPIHDLIVKFICPCGCGKDYYLPIIIDRVPAFERDDLGRIVKDAEGNPTLKTRISFEYTNAPRIHDAWTADMNDDMQVLYERGQAERDYAKKKPKPEIIAAVLA
jgi:hypothetical protein